MPTCPACGSEDREFVAIAVVVEVLRSGSLTAPCTDCRQVTFVFEPDMVCAPCQRLLPDLNERLRERFALHGPGSSEGLACAGCELEGQTRGMAQVVPCPHCAGDLTFEQDDFPPHGMFLSCPSCQKAVRIPRTVWCPKCGLNFRRTGIADLVRQANT